MELDALQDAHEDIRAAGGQLVAISPEEPSFAEDTRNRHDLTYPILFDEGNRIARKFGLEFQLAEELRPVFQDVLDVDLTRRNGDRSYTLPIPATYVVATDQTVTDSFVHADYTKRMEPRDVLEALDQS